MVKFAGRADDAQSLSQCQQSRQGDSGSMSVFKVSRVAFFVLLLTTLSIVASPQETYQKGTIRKGDPAGQSCDLINGNKGYQIGNCGEFHGGQPVDYRVKDKKAYIRHEGGQESKCPITAELSGILDPAAPTTQPLKYQKGTIEGFETRRDTSIFGGGGGGNGTPSSPVNSRTRIAKVYRLRGPDMIYKVDYCGAFQAGQFTPGQEVEYHAAGNRLYIRHDNDKEYSCQIEGTERPENARVAAQPGGSSAGPTQLATTSATSTAKLSITSIPDGADIEVDGSFSGNTPSDLEVPEGEHSITVKKTGYRNWERKMKLVAGSNIRLNAEMEQTTPQ